MGIKIKTEYGIVDIEKADQTMPYRLYRKVFKSKTDKKLVEEFGNIVMKYYPNYSENDILKLYETLSKSGCTYATMANAIIRQFDDDLENFKYYFGDEFCNSDGSINYNKLMIDIYACIANMVELKIVRYDSHKFNDYLEAATSLLGNSYSDMITAINDLNIAGWLGDGKDENGRIIVTNKRNVNVQSLVGTPREIAIELFNIDDPTMSINKLEELLKNANMEYSFDYLEVSSKFSGLEDISVKNLKKWLHIYFEKRGINLDLEVFKVNNTDISFDEFKVVISSILNDGCSINVSPSVGSNVYMTNGGKLGWSEIHNHAMNFEGFDKNGDILVCSWGKYHMIPKEYYNQLDFQAIKLIDDSREIKRGM